MAAKSVITITVVSQGTPAATIEDRYIGSDPGNPAAGCEKLANLLNAIAAGNEVGCVHVFSDTANGTQATGTVVCTQANAADGDTLLIGKVVLTVRTTPSIYPSDGEFAAGASDTAMGDNLAAAINAHPYLKAVCTAVNTAGSVALTMVEKGTHGNLYVLSETGTCMVVTTFASGAKGTVQAKARVFNRGQ